MKGKLFILSGPSGVGKGTVRENILANNEINLTYSISMSQFTKTESIRL